MQCRVKNTIPRVCVCGPGGPGVGGRLAGGGAAVATGAPGHLSEPRPVTDADDGAGDDDDDHDADDDEDDDEDDDGGVLPRGRRGCDRCPGAPVTTPPGD